MKKAAQFNIKSSSSFFATLVVIIMLIHIPGQGLSFTLAPNSDHNIVPFVQDLVNKIDYSISSKPTAILYTNHSLIRIDSDLDFGNQASAENWSGNGSEGAPYIIENYYLNGDGAGFCIYIGNTTVHYIIRNCSINNASGAYVSYKWNTGLILYNSVNGIVENNSFNNNNFIGVLSYYGDNNRISNNRINDGTYGIYILRSIENCVYNNSVSNTTSNGIYFVNSGNSIIDKNNIINNSGSGIKLSSSPPPMVTSENINKKSNFNNDHTEDTVLFKLAPRNFPVGQTAANVISDLKYNPGVVDIEHYSHVDIYKMQLDSTISVLETIKILELDPRVMYAEPDFLVYTDDIIIPNDLKYNFLWGLNNSGQTGGTSDADIDAPEAWTISNGSSDIVVAVIDTGVDYNHPDLNANMWKNPNETVDGVDNDGNGYIDDVYGIDPCNDDSDPMDDHSHGTHCSGTIGGVGNNSIGVVGVNWNVSIMALKFISKFNSGSTSDAIECINYMIMMKKNGTNLRVSSNSWGGGGFSKALYDAIEQSRQANILFIAASGNDYSDTDIEPHYPSSYNLTNILSVAATDHNDNRATFSNYGAHTVDVAAPGVGIYSTVLSNGYANKSGTSMATPHAAGLAALIAANNRSMDYNNLKNLIMSTVDPIPTLKGEMITSGRINAYNALNFSISKMHLYIQNPGNNSNLIKGAPVGIIASVTNGIEPILNAVINVTFNNGDPLLRLLDNGKDADQVAGDGYYSASWIPLGPITVNLTINATAPGFISLEKQISVNLINSNTITNNTVMNNDDYGIELVRSTSNIIENNQVLDNWDSGIYLEYSTHNQVINNSFRNNSVGIEINEYSYSNSIIDNIIESNYYNGIYFSPISGGHTYIIGNIIQNNDQDPLNDYPDAWLSGHFNKFIENEIHNDNSTAIYLFKANHTSLRNNTIVNNPTGFYSNHSVDLRLFDNKMTNTGIFIKGSNIEHWNTHRIDTTNTVNKRPVNYLYDQSNLTVPAGAGEIILANCTNITVTGQDLSMGTIGLLMGFTHRSYIYNNYLRSNGRNGIHLANSSSNNITNNSIIDSMDYGVFITQNSSNNTIWLNFFTNNSGGINGSVQAYDDGYNNYWDDRFGEGNYWSDYTVRYPTASNDGHVWNISYEINGTALAEDHYPLCNCTNYWSPHITDQTLNSGTTGDPFKFKVKVFDLFKITNVTVYYWFGSNIINPKNTTLTYNPSLKTYELDIILPHNSIQPLNYNVSAQDTKKNWGSSGVRTVTITDNDAPIADAGSDMEIHPGVSVKFNGTMSRDNIGIINYSWHFIYNEMDVYIYTKSFEFVFDRPGYYTVNLMVRDNEGLKDTDSVYITVFNKTKPKIFDLVYPSTMDVNEDIKIKVSVTDVNELKLVKINFTDVNDDFDNATMHKESGDGWSYIIPGQAHIGEITFFIYAANVFGNLTKTSNFTINIIDQFSPEISNISYPVFVSIDEMINISTVISDNAGLADIKLVYTDVTGAGNNISMDMFSQNLQDTKYNTTISAQNEIGTVRFHIWVSDINSNFNQTSKFNIDVIETPAKVTRPNIYSVKPSDGADVSSNESINVEVKVFDSSGLGTVYLNYIDTENISYNETMVWSGNDSFTFEIPAQEKVGTLNFFITAKNSLDIWNRTKEFVLNIVQASNPDNTPPYVDSTVPANNSNNIKLDTQVIITFNELILTSNLNDSILVEPGFDFNLFWNGIKSTTELTIAFESDLEYDRIYKIIIGTDISDISGNRMTKPFILIFTTISANGSFENIWDKDNDGMNDSWEKKFGLDPFIDDSAEDPDKDGYSNLEEFLADTDPKDENDHPKTDGKQDAGDLFGFAFIQLILILIIVVIITVILLIFLFSRRRKLDEQVGSEPLEQLDDEEPGYVYTAQEDDDYERIYGTSAEYGDEYAEVDEWVADEKLYEEEEYDDDWDDEIEDEDMGDFIIEEDEDLDESDDIEWDDEEENEDEFEFDEE